MDSDMVVCCCVHVAYVAASCQTGWNFCHTLNMCVVYLSCATLMWLFTVQISRATKCLATYVTFVQFLSCVDYHVTLQTAWLNALLHTWHLYSFPCGLPCDGLNVQCDEIPCHTLWHTRQLYRLCPRWILLCMTRLPEVVNCLSQTVHSNNFSPAWLCLCLARFWRHLKHLQHSVHLYLPAWIFTW